MKGLNIVSKILSPDDFLDFGNPLMFCRTSAISATLSPQTFGRDFSLHCILFSYEFILLAGTFLISLEHILSVKQYGRLSSSLLVYGSLR